MRATFISIAVLVLAALAGCSRSGTDPGPPEGEFEATLGVLNNGSSQHLAVLLLVPETQPGVLPALTVSGPAGWNGGSNYTIGLTAAQIAAGVALIDTERQWLEGDYQLKLNLPEEPMVTLTMPLSAQVLDQVTGLGASLVSATGARISWSPVPDSRLYSLQLSSTAVPPVAVSDGIYTVANLHDFSGLTLTPGSYQVEISAFSFDWIAEAELPEPGAFSWSRTSQPLITIAGDGTACDDTALNLDPALAAAIESTLGLSSEPGCSELAALTTLSATSLGISRLDGLQYAMDLKYLYVNGNDITDLAPLAGHASLFTLYLRDNPGLTDLSPLRGLQALDYLDLSSNVGITDLDPLSELPVLRRLALTALTALTDVTPLEGLSGLEHLDLSLTGVSSFDSLRGLSSLTALWLNELGLTTADIAFLEDLPQLRDLRLYGNDLVSLEPLADLTQLTYLDVGMNPLTDLSAIATHSIRDLSLSSTDVSQAQLFDYLGNLTEPEALLSLGVSGLGLNSFGPLTNGDFSGLYSLGISANNLTSLPDLTGLSSLEMLQINNNQLASVADLENLRDAFAGRTPTTFDSFYVYLSGNLFDGTDAAILAVVNQMRAQNVILDWPPMP